ncbi:MAG: hypothetical protein ACNA7W_00055 [Pseudomonadales bacterium]
MAFWYVADILLRMNHPIRVLLLTMVTASLGACVTTQTVEVSNASLRSEFGDREIAVVVYSEPRLHVVTPGDVTGLGLLDGLTRPDGSPAVFPSPSELIASRLKTNLGSKTDLNLREVANAAAPPSRRAEVRMDARDTLEVFTEVNQLGYRPMNWQTYQYILRAHARLTGSNGRMVWQEVCKVGGPSEDKTLQIDRSDIRQDGSHKLDALIEYAARQCADQIAARLGET